MKHTRDCLIEIVEAKGRPFVIIKNWFDPGGPLISVVIESPLGWVRLSNGVPSERWGALFICKQIALQRTYWQAGNSNVHLMWRNPLFAQRWMRWIELAPEWLHFCLQARVLEFWELWNIKGIWSIIGSSEMTILLGNQEWPIGTNRYIHSSA